MSDWPILSSGAKYTPVGADYTYTRGTAMVCSSVNTKCSWVTLSSSTPHEADFLLICVQNPGTNDCLIDIGIGATPDIVASNLFHSSYGNADYRIFYLPLTLPAGVALKARCQTDATGTFYIYAILLKGGFLQSPGYQRLTTHGAVYSGDTGGTLIDPGATPNVKGAWTQLSASITNPAKMLGVAIGLIGRSHEGLSPLTMLDIGVGPNPSQVVIIPDLPFRMCWGVTGLGSVAWFPVNIPTGTALWARAQTNGSNNWYDTTFEVVVYCLD